MLPGLDGTGELFHPFISLLPSGLNPIVCRYPDDDHLGYSELSDFAWECCPLNEPFLLLGESFSGPIAIKIGAKRPPVLKGIILVNTFVTCPRLHLAKILRSFPGWAFTKPPTLLLKNLLRGHEIGAEPLSAIRTVLRSLDSTMIRSRLASVIAVDVRYTAQDINVPVCVIQSENDVAVPRRARRLLLDSLMASESNKLKGNHFGLQANPAEASRIVSEFHRQVGL